MKKAFFFPFLFFFCIVQVSFSNFSLKVQDPKNTWKYANGSIDSASLVVTPKGTYCLYDLYLVFSSKGSQYTNLTDTLEVQYYFELNKNAIVTDSWLWVEDTLVKAKLIDRWSASQIYEGIVQRRRDPSIFYKNTATQYEFRIFPMAGSKTRKVKISWLEPVIWSGDKASIQLPASMLYNSNKQTNLNIIILSNEEWKNPALSFESNLPEGSYKIVQDPIYGDSYQADFKIGYLPFNSQPYITFDNPMQNGIYLKAYKETPEDGYFELAILPQKAFDLSFPKNVMFVLDYDLNFTSLQYSSIVNGLKNLLLTKFYPTDSFNILICGFNLQPLRDKWIQATPENIENILAEVNSKPITLYSLLPQLLMNSQKFIEANPAPYSSIAIISTSESFGKMEIANNIITSFKQEASKLVPINICDFSMSSTRNTINGVNYYGNSYLYINLAKLTGGEFIGNKMGLDYGLEKLSNSLNAKFIELEIKTNFEEGFCYSKYYLDQLSTLNVNSPVTMVGKYFGSGNFSTELTGILKAEKPYLIHKKIELTDFDVSSKNTKKVWLGKYLHSLEQMTNTNSIVSEIIATSMDNRILSLYTAFLALEPWMMGESQGNDENDDDNGGGTSVEYNDNSIVLEAFPNPFVRELNISINFKDKAEILTNIEIYNANGQLVTQLSPSQYYGQETVELKWNGLDSNGNQLPNGVYLIVIKTKSSTKTLKVILNR